MGFLRDTLLKLGFVDSWVDLVMICVTSVSYSVVHEGCSIGPIIPNRGLWQGDPLSPYLFIICAEGFSNLLLDYVVKGVLHRCKVAQKAPSVSHLFFADDIFIFFKASIQESTIVKECLDLYERASG